MGKRKVWVKKNWLKCTFKCNLKCKVKSPKGPKSGPYEIFLFFRWRSWTQTKFEAKPVEIAPFRTDQTVEPKNGPYPKPLFSDGNWKFERCQSGDIFKAAKLAKFQIRPTPGSKVMGIGILGPKKGAVPKIHYFTPITGILLGDFVAVGDPTVS